MRLTALDPRWGAAEGRHGMGLSFLCPRHRGTSCGFGRLFVALENPLDGGRPFLEGTTWRREGDTFETLTLTPSIHVLNGDGSTHWHGFVTAGEVS